MLAVSVSVVHRHSGHISKTSVWDCLVINLIASIVFKGILLLCFVTELMKVAQLTEAKNDETTNADLCSGNYSLGWYCDAVGIELAFVLA